MSGPSLVLVVIYILQSLVWSFGLFKASMLLFCLATGLSSGTIVYLLMKVLKKFNKNEIIKFCIFTFGNAFLAFLIFTIVYLFIPSPKIPLRDFFMERAGVVCVVTMYIMGIPLYFISRKIKSFH
jgi:hypothetical protein